MLWAFWKEKAAAVDPGVGVKASSQSRAGPRQQQSFSACSSLPNRPDNYLAASAPPYDEMWPHLRPGLRRVEECCLLNPLKMAHYYDVTSRR